jgi:predicted PurR-regulated permease PerM
VTAAIGWRLLVVAAALWVLGQIIAYLSGIVIPVAIALLLAALLAPAVQRLVQWRVPRGLATAMVLVGGLAALGVLLTFVVRTVVGGVPQLGASLAQSVGELSGWLANGPLHIGAEQLQAVQGQLQTSCSRTSGASPRPRSRRRPRSARSSRSSCWSCSP